MKKYTAPQMKISMFDMEYVTTAEEDILSQPVFGNNLNDYIQNKQNSVQKNLDFDEAIKFN